MGRGGQECMGGKGRVGVNGREGEGMGRRWRTEMRTVREGLGIKPTRARRERI